jgi:hypothetical protein
VYSEVISKIAVPVVSDPVPAVVGTGDKISQGDWNSESSELPAMRGRKAWVMGSPLPIGALIKSMRSESLYTLNLFDVKVR